MEPSSVLSYVAIIASGSSLVIAILAFLLNYRQAVYARRARITDLIIECEVLMSDLYSAATALSVFYDQHRDDLFNEAHVPHLRTVRAATMQINAPLEEWDCPFSLAESCKGAYALLPYLLITRLPGYMVFEMPRNLHINGQADVWQVIHTQKKLWSKWDVILQLSKGWFLGGGGVGLTPHQKSLAMQSVHLCLPLCVVHWIKNVLAQQGGIAGMIGADVVIDRDSFSAFLMRPGEKYKWEVYTTMVELSGEANMEKVSQVICSVFPVELPSSIERGATV